MFTSKWSYVGPKPVLPVAVLYEGPDRLHSVTVTTSDPLATFQSCRTLDGHTEPIAFARRGGRRVATMNPVWAEGGPSVVPSCPWIDDPRFYVNLNQIESRTWRQILSGLSIRAIAEGEGVSRSAIYNRIAGNRLGHGGMVGKNVWVLMWWRIRRRLTEAGSL